MASSFASASRLCNFAWPLAFLFLCASSSRLILFFTDDGSKRFGIFARPRRHSQQREERRSQKWRTRRKVDRKIKIQVKVPTLVWFHFATTKTARVFSVLPRHSYSLRALISPCPPLSHLKRPAGSRQPNETSYPSNSEPGTLRVKPHELWKPVEAGQFKWLLVRSGFLYVCYSLV